MPDERHHAVSRVDAAVQTRRHRRCTVKWDLKHASIDPTGVERGFARVQRAARQRRGTSHLPMRRPIPQAINLTRPIGAARNHAHVSTRARDAPTRHPAHAQRVFGPTSPRVCSRPRAAVVAQRAHPPRVHRPILSSRHQRASARRERHRRHALKVRFKPREQPPAPRFPHRARPARRPARDVRPVSRRAHRARPLGQHGGAFERFFIDAVRRHRALIGRDGDDSFAVAHAQGGGAVLGDVLLDDGARARVEGDDVRVLRRAGDEDDVVQGGGGHGDERRSVRRDDVGAGREARSAARRAKIRMTANDVDVG